MVKLLFLFVPMLSVESRRSTICSLPSIPFMSGGSLRLKKPHCNKHNQKENRWTREMGRKLKSVSYSGKQTDRLMDGQIQRNNNKTIRWWTNLPCVTTAKTWILGHEKALCDFTFILKLWKYLLDSWVKKKKNVNYKTVPAINTIFSSLSLSYECVCSQ